MVGTDDPRAQEIRPMTFNVEVEREDDGRWVAEVTDLPGALAYGKTREEAVTRVEILAANILDDRLE